MTERYYYTDTVGFIDEVVQEDGELHLRGWCLSQSAGPASGFLVSVAGHEFGNLEVGGGVRTNLPSSDIHSVYTGTPRSDRARFEIVVSLQDATLHKVSDSLVVLVPLFDELKGSAIYGFVDPTFPVPDEDLINAIGGGFHHVALEFLGLFVHLGGLKPSDCVLDVGCGVGRMACSLSYFLRSDSRCEGFDIVDCLIEWAQENITSRYPNFIFRRLDVYNEHYNPNGKLHSEDLVFPYDDACFDFVFMTSVFTHMGHVEIKNYLSQVNRVLKSNGTCFLTLFILNRESIELMRFGKSSWNLIHPALGGYAADPNDPEACLGFSDEDMLEWFGESGFTLQNIYYGFWCGRRGGISYQDIVILKKTPTL